MKSKIVPVLFVLAAALIAGVFFFSKKVLVKEDKSSTRARIVTPKSAASGNAENESSGSSIESEKYETFVPLYSGETLISTLTIDINNDGYDDEVIIVRKANSQNLWIVAALIDSESGLYERLAPIETQFTRTRTFSYMGMDVTGEHKNALIYQGLADNGNYIMAIYLCAAEHGKNYLRNIGDFACDGTVFIQQTERSESYALAMSKGESFSVWVYKSDSTGAAAADGKSTVGQNQIQQEYKWNPSSQKYELAREIYVNAGRLAATELSRIQDGTVETFAAFLDGLWYKTSSDDGVLRYIYFNYEKLEIILLEADSQEVYEWDDSKLRHNGIYLYTVNSDITNLQRRFDILLTSVEEIKITLYDSIGLIIKESSVWDGQYKKLSLQSSIEETDTEEKNQFIATLEAEELWTTTDGLNTLSLNDHRYTFTYDGMQEEGVYSVMKIGTYNVLQLRSTSFDTTLNQTYAMEFGTKIVTETVKKQTIEKTVTDYDTIIFTPVKITPTDCFATDGRVYTFTKNKE